MGYSPFSEFWLTFFSSPPCRWWLCVWNTLHNLVQFWHVSTCTWFSTWFIYVSTLMERFVLEVCSLLELFTLCDLILFLSQNRDFFFFFFFNFCAGLSAGCLWRCSLPYTWVSAAQCGQFSMLLPGSGVPSPATVPLQFWVALPHCCFVAFFTVSDLVNSRLLTAFASWCAVAVWCLVLFLLP